MMNRSSSTSAKGATVTELELVELINFCYKLFYEHRAIDYYATTVGIGLVITLGVLGNAGTLLTLSGRRLTTATFVYYRAIAFTDLIRCVFVLSYVLRVVVPFYKYYGATWYEAHLLYFIINTLSFVSTSLAVTLCVRLCIGILQSRRLKKTKTNPKTTRIYIYIIVVAAFVVNACLCFEYDAVERQDYCSRNGTVHPTEYTIRQSAFHAQNPNMLRAIRLVPIVILLALLCGAGSILGCCLYAMQGASSGRKPAPKPPSSPKSSTNAILLHHCPSVRHSRPWRTQRQLCNLFLLLCLCYALGLLPEFLNVVIFSKVDSCNCTSRADNYRNRIKQHFDRENFAAISNIFQNIGHALSFYVYVLCSEAFRGEFLVKLRHLRSRFCAVIWPYSRALGCTNTFISDKMSQSSDTKHALRSITLLAELDSEEGFATTFAPEQIITTDQAAMDMLDNNPAFATAAVSYTDMPVFTLAALARRMSAHLYTGFDSGANNGENKSDDGLLGSEHVLEEEKEERNLAQIDEEELTSTALELNNLSSEQTTNQKPTVLSPVQLHPTRYQRFYSSDRKKVDSNV